MQPSGNSTNTTKAKKAENEQALQEEIEGLIHRVRTAQQRYATFSQQEVDAIFAAVTKAAIRARIPLAEAAWQETKMGLVEDKVIKNHYAAEYVYNAYRTEKTCGEIERDDSSGIVKIAEPKGVIAALIPTTNPISTAIFKALIALKTRNGVIFSPHPRAKKCTKQAMQILLRAAVEAGAPEDIFAVIENPSKTSTAYLMQHCDFVLATGGTEMVKAAYSSGTPAIGVGAGNTPVIIDSSANVQLAVSSVIHSKTFDNGVICSSEQSCIVLSDVYDQVKSCFLAGGAHFLTDEEKQRVTNVLFSGDSMRAESVGRSAEEIASLASVLVPSGTRLLVAECPAYEPQEPFNREKLAPVLVFYRAQTFDEALFLAESLLNGGGKGHTAAIYASECTAQEKITRFAQTMKACRILVNTPAAQGGIGDLYNFRLPPSLTLGCGSWGGNSTCENVGVRHLLNVKTVAKRRGNMLWLQTPQKIYFERGCLSSALRELKTVYGKRRVFIVTDQALHEMGFSQKIVDILNGFQMQSTVFFEVQPDPTLASAKEGARQMIAFRPDAIVAVGGGSAIDAAKIMWAYYENPEVDFTDASLRFMDIKKRTVGYPEGVKKSLFVAVPTTAGTGSEVTPFAVITDEKTGVKHPVADYALLPNIAVIDAELTQSAPPSLTAAAGIDAVVHALEAIGSVMATEFTTALAKEALQILFEYLPVAYERGNTDIKSREKTARAATMAGIAFGNAFLGLCHAMAHKAGAFFHIPHGVANAIFIRHVLQFNASAQPAKMATFPQYDHPQSMQRYADLADFLGFQGNTEEEKFQALLAQIEGLIARLNLPKTLRECGVEEERFLAALDEMTKEAFDDQCLGANPRYPLMEEIRTLYKKAYYGEEKPLP
ncbi:MAG: bifunctional acetaldehyde-CoA/alcohol dehydrogenase [Clostridia bacterium]|nr:bifunctional acetaldehyde-CoA/alcohol dehydrogenase [Clostridia bacterium]